MNVNAENLLHHQVTLQNLAEEIERNCVITCICGEDGQSYIKGYVKISMRLSTKHWIEYNSLVYKTYKYSRTDFSI